MAARWGAESESVVVEQTAAGVVVRGPPQHLITLTPLGRHNKVVRLVCAPAVFREPPLCLHDCGNQPPAAAYRQ